MKQSLIWAALALAGNLSAEDLALDARLMDLEAQVDILQTELRATKSLAEQERPSAFNPSISVIGDIIGQYGHGFAEPKDHDHAHDHAHGAHHHEGHSHDHDFQNGVLVREVEFEFRGDIDPWADALVVLAVHQPKFNEFEIHLEEAYARLKQWPGLNYAPLGIQVRAGRFKTAIGRMNRIHMHNIPQITYPLAMRTFLGDEGFASQGLSLNATYPISQHSALTLFVEGVMGSRLPMQGKDAAQVPSGIAHAWWHQELAPAHFLDIGASSLLGRKGKAGSGLFWLMGGDVHYSYLPAGYGQNPVFLLGSEIYAANKVVKNSWPIGNFTWAQVRLMGSSFLGARYDLAPQEHALNKFQHALGAYIGFYTTEFLRFRFGYEHVMPSIKSFAGDHRYMLSMNFVLGSHPVEPYFVNR